MLRLQEAQKRTNSELYSPNFSTDLKSIHKILTKSGMSYILTKFILFHNEILPSESPFLRHTEIST